MVQAQKGSGMAAGTVRRLRISPITARNPIDDVSNPTLLAHQLLNLNNLVEHQVYTDRLRLSSIADVCVREQLLGFRNSVERKTTLAIGLQITFDLGNGIHDFFQNHTGYFGHNSLAWWRCSACRKKQFGRKPKQNCPHCNALHGAFRYEEHSLRLPDEIPLTGHPDYFLEVGSGDIRVVDFKTINGEEFALLNAPKYEHVMQVTGYMEYLQRDETLPISVNPSKGFILYISKKHQTKTLPFKMFHVEKSIKHVEIIREKVSLFGQGLADPSFLPPVLESCRISEFLSGRAKSCPVAHLCQR